MPASFRTTAAYVSGAMVGRIWMPDTIAGYPHCFDLRGRIARFSDPSGLTFREILLSELTERGGDFQSAQFSADTVIRVERRAVTGPGKYSVHVWEREVSQLRYCADLVNAEVYTSDVMGEC